MKARYQKEVEGITLVIDSEVGARGHSVISGLGFRTDFEIEAEKRANATKERLAELRARKQAEAGVPIEQADPKVGPPVIGHGGEPTKDQLMQEARANGVKNFRVMNKAELLEIHHGATPERIADIQATAVARWKAGWSK